MNVVGRVGSLISQGVYSVATPFHPFGGAVDIIVVEQQDGTYRSTPWYVQFGKFQGVLKGNEKVVTIAVNGVEANFHMYLDNSGEAYFMREVTLVSQDEEETSDQVFNQSSPRKSDQPDKAGNSEDDHQDTYDERKGETESDEYEFQNEQSSKGNSNSSPEYNTYHYGSLEEVDNLVKSSENVDSEMLLVSVDGHVLMAPISSNEQNTDIVQLTTPQFHLGPGEGSGEDFCATGGPWEFGDVDVSKINETETSGLESGGPEATGGVSIYDPEALSTANGNMGRSSEDILGLSKNDTFKSCLDLMAHIDEGELQGAPSVCSDAKDEPEHSAGTLYVSNTILEGTISNDNANFTNGASLQSADLSCNGGLHSVSVGVEVFETTVSVDLEQNVDHLEADRSTVNCDQTCYDGSPTTSIETQAPERKTLDGGNREPAGSCDFSVRSVCDDPEKKHGDILGMSTTSVECSAPETPRSGLGIEISLCGNLLRPGMGCTSAEVAFEAHRISEEEFKTSGATFVKNGNLIVRFEGKYFPWHQVAHIILGMGVYGSNFSLELKDPIPVEHEEVAKARDDAHGVSPSSSRRWRLWPIPFRRTRSLQHSNRSVANEDLFVDSESGLPSPCAEQGPSDNNIQSPRKQFLRTKIPTNEQIASLNLKDGQNMITFSFSTRVLGRQQVDAHIFLWKWNARIVISDVDGTITKSDVLGQFMPLVGKDWTQFGVARLFSAIKENGYQLLFLSARAIVQAYLTRSFLINLKQDGKALPNGPVVISPDGLFPSLFREVIQRAPHEFKIACLEDIRALFPSDYNPFYAGFGNRDTDELSYRKIGIPKGKIFIINPKGEVAINHCIDVKTYTSLHTLVNDMFPPTSLVEQEDYNSWNYWKMPLPNIDS